MMRHRQKTRGQFSTAVWTGDLRTGNAHRVKRLTRIVKTGRQKSLLGVLTENRVTAERIVHSNVHNVASIKMKPTNRAA